MMLFERFKLPGVGLILAGVICRAEGLGILERDSMVVLLCTVGLLSLMFMAGLDNLDDFNFNG